MATLCNKKVTHTQTISNAIGYSMYTWKASPTEAPTSVVAPCHPWQNSSMTFCFHHRIMVNQATSLTFCENHHRISSVTWLLWWKQWGFHHKFVIKLKLWQIWLIQWWKLIIIEVDIPTSNCRDIARHATSNRRSYVMRNQPTNRERRPAYAGLRQK